MFHCHLLILVSRQKAIEQFVDNRSADVHIVFFSSEDSCRGDLRRTEDVSPSHFAFSRGGGTDMVQLEGRLKTCKLFLQRDGVHLYSTPGDTEWLSFCFSCCRLVGLGWNTVGFRLKRCQQLSRVTVSPSLSLFV